ncbi:MAG: ABC transporter ATP-binding protein/permease [Actinomycetia bacterium]|nr:ABC transporter ATP-binding protein/permease [Actinomycetes bacterium]
MRRLARFLKPYALLIFLAIVLLFVQVISELNLPNLMSNIVNIGIQQGGIEEASPQAISADGLRFVKIFMSSDEQTLVSNSYTLVSGSDLDAQGRPYSETWPNAASQQIYVRQDLDRATLDQLNQSFGLATWTMLNVLQQLQSSSASGSLTGMAAPGNATAATAGSPATATADSTSLDISTSGVKNLDITQVYPYLPLLEALPPNIIAEARASAETMDSAMLSQSATMLVGAFYRELGRDMNALEMNYIWRIGLIMLLVAAIVGVATILVGYIAARVGAGVARNIRSAIFSKVISFSHAEFDRFSTASLITRSTNDVMMLQMVVIMGLRMIFYAPIMGVGAAIMAVGKSLSMSWIIVVAVVVMLGGVLLIVSLVMPKFRLMQKLIDRLNLVSREKLNGLMVIRAFNRDDVEQQRFDVANHNLTNTNIFVGRVMTMMMPFMMIVMNGMSILIVWFGGHQIAASQMQVGDMMAYIQYIMQVMFSFMFISMIFMFLPRAQVSAGRVNEVLDTEPVIVDPPDPLPLDPDKKGLVEFRDVSFRFEGAEADVLSGINFTARPGQTVAFIGPTGSGKSTILNLIPRFYDVQSGAVLVNGRDVREVSQNELRSHIGYVPQAAVLMGGTIASNITYGVEDHEVSYEELNEIADVAQALDFIAEKPEGYDFPIAQAGVNVSGGQKQRLSIARALAIHPDIYLFDDSFSALDFTTDAALRKALRAYTSQSTLLIVSQRIGTIMDADVINVIDNGRLVGSGQHEELLKTCSTYYEIASSQLTELADANNSASWTERGAQ